MHELRLTVRRLLNARAFTLTAALTVAVAVGVNGMIFSAVRGLLVHPLPFAEAEQLVWVYGRDRLAELARDRVTGLEVNTLATQAASVQSVAVIGDRSFVRPDGDRRVPWTGLWVTQGIFDVLRIRPALGRAFDAADMRSGAHVMILGYERWQRDLGGDPTIIGRPIRFIDNHEFIVIGVLPPGLEFPFGRMPLSGNGSGFAVGVQDFWIPGQEGDVLPGGATIARVRADASIDRVRAEAATISARLAASDGGHANRALEVVPIRDQALGLVRPGLRLAQAFALAMLLLACANLANLTLLRTSTRERELGVRAALGASRRVIAGSVVGEVVLVTAVGAVVGLGTAGLARVGLRFIATGSLPMLERVTVDWTVVAFTVSVAAVVAVLVAVIPAVLVMRGNLHLRLLSGGGRTHTTDRRRTRLRAGLVVSQVALALVLSVGAALVVESFVRLMAVDAGYDPTGVISVDVALFDHPQGHVFYRELHARLNALPGVEAVGMIQSTPLTGKWTFTEPFAIVGRPGDPESAPHVSGGFVAFDYFEAMRTPVVAGRAFTAAEYLASDAPALMINESAARRFFPNASPLGESVFIAGKARRIVGVVKDMRDVRLDAPPKPQWFQPLFGDGTQLIIRTTGRARAMVPTLRRAIVASDSRLVIGRIDALEDIVATTVIERRMAMRLLVSLAAIALALASVGLYGVLGFNVARREREFGIRSALGAPRRSLLAMVLRDGLGMAAFGVALGVLLAIALTGALRGLLFEVSPTEPGIMAAVAAMLVLVASIASVVPAWRAASADPVHALRAD
jgi:putative ABC transport system permease protein